MHNLLDLQCIAHRKSLTAFMCVLGYDMDPRPHGNSSGYHSDDNSPTRKSEASPIHEFRMPGMLDRHDSQTKKAVQPSDVVIMVRI